MIHSDQDEHDSRKAAARRAKLWDAATPIERKAVLERLITGAGSVVFANADRKWHELSGDVYAKLASDASWWDGNRPMSVPGRGPVRAAPRMAGGTYQ